MRIDWRPDNRPDAAYRIAEHTQKTLDAMNRAKSAKAVKELFDSWWNFARDNRVCHQICEHMVSKRRTMVGDFEKPKPAMSAMTKRMTGEANE